MALISDQQSNFKHFCKICKKGFGCGRALGGHMRAHGIGDESGHMDDDDQASDWEDRLGGNVPPSNKRMYALRTNPNRLKSCRVCENCGKEFLSWKSFLEHGKCTSEDAESLVSSPGSDADDGDIGGGGRRGCGWSKSKRSLRTKVGSFNYNCPSSEEEDLANCLLMLSNAIVDPLDDVITHEEFFPTKKNSTLQFDHGSSNPSLASSSKRKSKVHECSICHRSFSSGQALGGHKRCHWITSNAPDTSTLTRFQQFQEHLDQIPKFDTSSEPLDLKLDLNLPAPSNDLARRNVNTEFYLQPWVASKDAKDDNNNSHCQSLHNPNNNVDVDNDEDKNNNNNNNSMQNMDNEADSKIKLAKLSELKDMKAGGSSSPWLQVGISSTATDVEADNC
ncbi:zinc finger protein ZAT1 [Glycine max]|uniref:C2H2-type domain-containing protein n=1 Tax=Glycine max TaxID=3847 RepID=K7KCL3_SOYBN|nr:zinc finger protein ZAT1 [Glycine max]